MVDHLVFDLKEFENIKVGDRVCVKVKISKEIHVGNNVEGIRTPDKAVDLFTFQRPCPAGFRRSRVLRNEYASDGPISPKLVAPNPRLVKSLCSLNAMNPQPLQYRPLESRANLFAD